jgi:hypothetical protein
MASTLQDSWGFVHYSAGKLLLIYYMYINIPIIMGGQ